MLRPSLACFLILYSLFCLPLLSAEGDWKFGIMGDTHDSPPRTPGWAGVSADNIARVNKEFIKHKVDFVVQCGDLADAQGGQDEQGFMMRYEIARELLKAGIPFHAIRGNHDAGKMRAEQMKEFFIPGAKNAPKPKGYIQNGLDYAFRHKNASLYFMDIDNSLNPDKLVKWSEWMLSYRNNPDRPTHCIVFAHRNLHVPINFRENLFARRLNNAEQEQNIFYRNLYEAGVDLFASAHLHIHARARVKSPDGKYTINSLVTAVCGDKVFSLNIPLPSDDRAVIDKSITNALGYYIVTVSGNRLKIDMYSVQGQGRKNSISPNDEFKLTDSWVVNAIPPLKRDTQKSAPEKRKLITK